MRAKRITDDVLDGYPSHLAVLLPDLRGVRLRLIASRYREVNRTSMGKYVGRYTFLAYFPKPPWSCKQCGEPILLLGNNSASLNIHHANEDRDDNRLINLIPLHNSCHTSYHRNYK